MAKANNIVGLKSDVTGVQLVNSISRMVIDSGKVLDYSNRIPEATQTNLKDVGKALFNYEPAMNEFLRTLVNRIGLVVVRNRSYSNKLAFLKRGMLDYGDSIEEIMVDIAKAKQYEVTPPDNNPADVFAVEKPEVKVAFHKVNRENYYKVTVNEEMLRRAFTSYGNFDSFVSSIFNSMYNGDSYDEYILFKQLLGESAKESYLVHVDMPTSADKATTQNFSIAIREWALNLEYMSNKYNRAGITTFSELGEQILVLKSSIVPVIDVVELSNAFNKNLAEPISGRVIVVDDFGEGNDEIVAMIIDREFSMIYDLIFRTDSIYNPQYMYWNFFLHRHQIISSSPFSNVIAFTTGSVTSKVNSVSVSPKQTSVIQGTTEQFQATIDYTGTPDLTVTWSVEGSTADGTKIDSKTGLLTVALDEPTESSITVKATVGEQSDSATVTVEPFIVS